MANNLADKFEEMADAAPERLALISPTERVSYAELEARANQFAHHLAEAGVRRDDAVALVARNSVPFVVAFLACFKLRAVPVNVNYRYRAVELAELFADSGSVAVVVHSASVTECADAIGDAAEPHHVVVIGSDIGAFGGRAVTYDSAIAGQSSARDFPPRSGDDINMLYTGGTTGSPKGVVWRQEDTYLLCSGGRGTDEAVAAARNEDVAAAVTLPAGPFVHSSSQWTLLGSLLAGRCTVVVERFDPETIWRLCDEERVEVLMITGDAMAGPLLAALTPERPPPSSIRAVTSSGGVLSPSLKDALRQAFPQAYVVDALGSSETGLLGISPADKTATSSELRVTAAPDTLVVGRGGTPVLAGVAGMLAKSGVIPLRYHNDPEKTAETFFTRDGVRYAISGDAARLETDGTITVLGRESACINSGGEKIYPIEVENVLKSHPSVDDCLVVAVPDPRWSQRVGVIVQPVRGQHVTLDELQSRSKATLAGYKAPRALCIVDQLSRQPSGKPDYRWAAFIVAQGIWTRQD